MGEPQSLSNRTPAVEPLPLTIYARRYILLRDIHYALHGEPLHPDPAIAGAYQRDFLEASELAEKTGVTRLILTSGLPEGAPGDRTPDFYFFPHIPRILEQYQWQWEKRVIPYWKKHGKIAQDHGVRLCIEMVPSDLVFNPETFLRLREAVGPVIGVNFDPSHLVWQGIDIVKAIHALGDTIYHVHAKDIQINPEIARVNGVLDPRSWNDPQKRSWFFRTIGLGHQEDFWRDFVNALRQVGYDDVISIEHEDSLLEPVKGLESAVGLLRMVLQ